MDTALVDILKWLIPIIVAGVSSFAGIKIGLKNLSEKFDETKKSVSERLDDNKKIISEKIDKLDLKLEKISEQQIKTDKDLTLVEHRVKQIEENHEELEDTLKTILNQFEKLRLKFSVLQGKAIDKDEE